MQTHCHWFSHKGCHALKRLNHETVFVISVLYMYRLDYAHDALCVLWVFVEHFGPQCMYMCSKNAALFEYLIIKNFIHYFELKLNDWPFEYLKSLVIMHKIPAPMRFYTKCCNTFTRHTTFCIPTLQIMALNCKTIESSSVPRRTHQHGNCRLK